MATILIIEDEAVLARNLARALEVSGHACRVASTAAEGLRSAGSELPDVVLCDLRLPDATGLDVLTDLKALDAGLPVLIMTAFATIRDAVQAMRDGATDYLQKPLDLDAVRAVVGKALETQRRDRELGYLRLRDSALPRAVVSGDSRIREIFRQMERVRSADLAPGQRPPVLLTGETGTGKGLIARAIHETLGGGPFVEVNCTALPATLAESELFGHERGSFTDAKTARVGLFEAAQGGTLFLDEIGHMDVATQAKLLTAIEDRRIRRLGATSDKSVDVQIIAATNRALDQAVTEGQFRSDLLHRLRVIAFEIPPLRERAEDVVELADHFCAEFAGNYGGRQIDLGDSIRALLGRHPWPGNVRELRNVIERLVLLSPEGAVDERIVRDALGTPPPAGPSDVPLELPAEGISLEDLERGLLEQALARSDGNLRKAASSLGISSETLRYRARKFGLR